MLFFFVCLFMLCLFHNTPLMVTLSSYAGVLMVYFSGYLIETTGSWATVFALITTVNLLGLCTFLAFAEARRVDIDTTKVRHPNIHI